MLPNLNHFMTMLRLPTTRSLSKTTVNLQHNHTDDEEDACYAGDHDGDAGGAIVGRAAVIGVVGSTGQRSHQGLAAL